MGIPPSDVFLVDAIAVVVVAVLIFAPLVISRAGFGVRVLLASLGVLLAVLLIPVRYTVAVAYTVENGTITGYVFARNDFADAYAVLAVLGMLVIIYLAYERLFRSLRL